MLLHCFRNPICMTNIYCTNPKKDRKMKSHGSAVSKKTFVAFWINNLHDDKKKLHISPEIDQICSQSTPAKCKMPRTGQFLPRRRARGSHRAGGKWRQVTYSLGMPNGLLPLGLRRMILDPKRIPNVWFPESRLLFRNVGKHSSSIYHRYMAVCQNQ